MGFNPWKIEPLDEPMCRVKRREFGDGKVRYVLEFYEGTMHANWRAEQKWTEGKSYKSEQRAQRVADENARWMRAQAYRDTPTLPPDTAP